jgi:hypothetical protein
MASQFLQLPFPNESNSANFARLPRAPTSGSSNFIKFPLGINPTPPTPLSIYIANAGITNSTEITAITNFYNTLVSDSLFNLFDRLYPISPTSLSAAAYDLVTGNPLTWVNTPTEGHNGVTFDGSTQYGITDANMSALPLFGGTQFLGHIFCYLHDQTSSNSGGRYIGAADASNNNTDMERTSNFVSHLKDQSFTEIKVGAFAKGGYSLIRVAANSMPLYYNGVLVGTSVNVSTNGTSPTVPLTLAAMNSSGTIQNFQVCTLSFVGIGAALNATQQLAFYNAVLAYQTALTRQ